MACGLAYVGIEEVLPRLFDVGLGVGLHQAVGLRQLAELGGVDLLTWLVVTVNLLLWQTFARIRTGATSDLRAAVPAIVALVLVVSGMGYGLIRFAQLEAATASAPDTLAVAIVQGSVPNQTRLAWARGNEEAAELQLGRYLALTEPTVGREVDLIVWPEATFPGIFGQPKSRGGLDRANRFDRFVLKLDTPIVFGAYDLDREQGGATLFNAVFSIEPDPRARRRGGIGRIQRYHKHLLLPFAESLPGFLDRAGVRRLLPGLGAFGRGPGVRLLPIERDEGRFVRLVPILCSESLSTLHALEGARLGGHLLLNVGSDGWFGNLGEPEFHLAISRFRSIETRLPQIRSANSGISGLILPSGEVLGQTELGEQRRVELEIGLVDSSPTPVVRWGNWFGRWAIGASAVFGIALFVFYRRRS
jgi:apolipoprotein N-acyltransferase